MPEITKKLLNFVKVMLKILVVPFFSRHSIQRTGWLPSAVTKTNVTCCDVFSSSSVVSHTVSVLCVYSTFGHHPHPLGCLCAKFCFFCGLHCWASPCRKMAYSITQSITHSPSLFDARGTEAFASEQCQATDNSVEYGQSFMKNRHSSHTPQLMTIVRTKQQWTILLQSKYHNKLRLQWVFVQKLIAWFQRDGNEHSRRSVNEHRLKVHWLHLFLTLTLWTKHSTFNLDRI